MNRFTERFPYEAATIEPEEGAIANIPLPIPGGATVGEGASKGASQVLADITPPVGVARNNSRNQMTRVASNIQRSQMIGEGNGRSPDIPSVRNAKPAADNVTDGLREGASQPDWAMPAVVFLVAWFLFDKPIAGAAVAGVVYYVRKNRA